MPAAEIIQLCVLVMCVLAALALTFIALKNSYAGKYLCQDCKYNDPAMCSKKERPKAIACLAYKAAEKG